jgi:hypothetical protein
MRGSEGIATSKKLGFFPNSKLEKASFKMT